MIDASDEPVIVPEADEWNADLRNWCRCANLSPERRLNVRSPRPPQTQQPLYEFMRPSD